MHNFVGSEIFVTITQITNTIFVYIAYMSTVCCVHVQKRNFAHFRKCRKSAIIAGSQLFAIPQNVNYAQLAFLLIHKQLVLPYVMRVYTISHKNYAVAKNCCACKTFMGAALWALTLSTTTITVLHSSASVRISTNKDAIFFIVSENSGLSHTPCPFFVT